MRMEYETWSTDWDTALLGLLPGDVYQDTCQTKIQIHFQLQKVRLRLTYLIFR